MGSTGAELAGSRNDIVEILSGANGTLMAMPIFAVKDTLLSLSR